MLMKEKFELETARGVRDIPPEEMILRQKVTDNLRKIFEKYGYDPLETPIIERLDVLSVKFGAGVDSDAMREVFKFKDQGNRNLGLRFELTLSMCRYIAMNPNTKMPFKRYEIGRVYRDGPIKLGRSREFYQCDVDIVGTGKIISDAEIIKLALDAFNELGLDAYVEVNSRKILSGILAYADVTNELRMPAIIVIDKLNKIGPAGVREELGKLGVKKTSTDRIIKIFETKGEFKNKVSRLKELLTDDTGKEGINEIEELFSYLSEEEKKKVVFNISLARGLSYYTGIVFEGYLKNSKITSSICGGGRYDDLISLLLQSKEKVPATGISFGLVPIMEALKLENREEVKTVTKVFIIPIGKTQQSSLEICQQLRKAGINTDLDLIGRGISKNLNYANILNIPYILFIGERELKEGKVKLRDMATGKEEMLSINEAIKRLIVAA
jgi:histidyl-tRNA synthetase